MQGKKHPPEVKEKAMALLSVTGNYLEVARQLDLPESTVRTWQLKSIENNDEFAKLREKKKREFVQNAWVIIEKALKLANRRITTALEKEQAIDDIITELQQDKKLNESAKQILINKLKSLQVQQVRDISTFVGTLYDKAALAAGDATNRVNANLTFEQLIRELKETEEG